MGVEPTTSIVDGLPSQHETWTTTFGTSKYCQFIVGVWAVVYWTLRGKIGFPLTDIPIGKARVKCGDGLSR